MELNEPPSGTKRGCLRYENEGGLTGGPSKGGNRQEGGGVEERELRAPPGGKFREKRGRGNEQRYLSPESATAQRSDEKNKKKKYSKRKLLLNGPERFRH